MKQNLFWNSVMANGAILGLVMVASHIFEQCAVVYGKSMGWLSFMGFEMIFSIVLFIWMLYRFVKRFSEQVMAEQSIKMFGYGTALGYVFSVSALSGVIVGLGRYILHNIIIGHKAYTEGMITTMQSILKSNPQTSSMMDAYNQMFSQMAAQPEPTIIDTVISAIWGYMFWGLVVGLIIAAFVKKEPQVFDSQNSQE